MSLFQAILLGALQGATEFLPVSSSGHLMVAQHLFSLDETPLLFDVFLHVATLAAVVVYFHAQLWELLCAFGRMVARRPINNSIAGTSGLTRTDAVARRSVLAIVVATLVTGAIGVVVEKFLPTLSIRFVCAGFIITAFILIFANYASAKRTTATAARANENRASENADKSAGGVSVKQALVIGAAQGIGTLPGISRSGSTIAGGLLCGVNRADAGEFSFIVSIPAILGAFILQLRDLTKMGESVGAAALVAGCLAAFFVGGLSLALLMRIIKKGKLAYFAFYLIPLGALGLIFLR